jgi:amidase
MLWWQSTGDPKEYADAPISLQLIGRRGEEEAVIRLTEIIDEALKASA